jgi:hypothetical protein
MVSLTTTLLSDLLWVPCNLCGKLSGGSLLIKSFSLQSLCAIPQVLVLRHSSRGVPTANVTIKKKVCNLLWCVISVSVVKRRNIQIEFMQIYMKSVRVYAHIWSTNAGVGSNPTSDTQNKSSLPHIKSARVYVHYKSVSFSSLYKEIPT